MTDSTFRPIQIFAKTHHLADQLIQRRAHLRRELGLGQPQDRRGIGCAADTRRAADATGWCRSANRAYAGNAVRSARSSRTARTCGATDLHATCRMLEYLAIKTISAQHCAKALDDDRIRTLRRNW